MYKYRKYLGLVEMGNLKKIFGDNARVIVLEHLIRNPDSMTYPSGIAEETGLSNSTVSRVMEPLLKLDMVREIGPSKRVKSFELNKDNGFTKALLSFYEEIGKISNG